VTNVINDRAGRSDAARGSPDAVSARATPLTDRMLPTLNPTTSTLQSEVCRRFSVPACPAVCRAQALVAGAPVAEDPTNQVLLMCLQLCGLWLAGLTTPGLPQQRSAMRCRSRLTSYGPARLPQSAAHVTADHHQRVSSPTRVCVTTARW
jgi:hypothetical protein